LETTEGGFMGAGWFWSKNGLNAFADKGDIVTISKRINGGTIGLESRKELYSAAQRAFTFS
ncbi:MAG: glycoside hydrolase family 19 protein, partial [Moraxellaceae bacterium]